MSNSFSWVDIEENKGDVFQKPTDSTTYSSIVKAEPPIFTPTTESKEKVEDKKNKKSRKKCYTCKPRGKVLKHIIEGTGCDNVVFHFDLHKRPIILVTPKTHYETLYEIPHEEIINIFMSIRTFCDFWKIKDYQISFNNGNWQTHSHFHIKIKMNEKIINRLRRDHFRLVSLNNNYKS